MVSIHFILLKKKKRRRKEAWQEKVTLMLALSFIIGDWNEATELLNGPSHAISAKMTIEGKDGSSRCGHAHIVEELRACLVYQFKQ